MKKVLLLSVLIIISVSCKSDKTNESITNGIVENGYYTNTDYKLKLKLPEKQSVFYPISETKEIPNVIQQKINDNHLLLVGMDDKNYMSVYLNPLQKQENIKFAAEKYYPISKLVCKNLEKDYANGREIAYHQNWSDVTINEIPYNIYDIELVTYPKDESIVHSLVYVRQENKAEELIFSINYTDKSKRKALEDQLVASLVGKS